MDDRKILIAKYAERIDTLINGPGGKPHSFEVNSLAGYLHYFILEELEVCDSKKAESLGLNVYLDRGERTYVEVPQKEN